MIKWFFKKMNFTNSVSDAAFLSMQNSETKSRECADGIEQSLWEIKEIYDIPTEEVARTVRTKRENLKYMHKILKNSDKDIK